MKIMEKDLTVMVEEVERLCDEVLNAKKKAHCVAGLVGKIRSKSKTFLKRAKLSSAVKKNKSYPKQRTGNLSRIHYSLTQLLLKEQILSEAENWKSVQNSLQPDPASVFGLYLEF
ncbi:Hypothetical predicted protein [Olea europaea subsp. europaea]|uniref:Uncharacterized protein n=1 Tax=Olea europaea subsp. europaea TaxID=158383 RepID=A0A8S0Q2Z7_OLEEU|nr:Hypothetical predicted protein [Olea europaea subsp. europaea]